jgi:hypothetical protein
MSLFYFVARYGPWPVFLIGADLLWSAAIKKKHLEDHKSYGVAANS